MAKAKIKVTELIGTKSYYPSLRAVVIFPKIVAGLFHIQNDIVIAPKAIHYTFIHGSWRN